MGDRIFVNKLAYGLGIPRDDCGRPLARTFFGQVPVRAAPIHRGDIIVFTAPYDRSINLIKRVIGVPGDRVRVINGVVWRNGERILDPHAYLSTSEQARSPYLATDNFPPRDARHPERDPGPVVVPSGKLFMMGDNRDDSYDSRFWGFADQNDVEGRASVIYFLSGIMMALERCRCDGTASAKSRNEESRI